MVGDYISHSGVDSLGVKFFNAGYGNNGTHIGLAAEDNGVNTNHRTFRVFRQGGMYERMRIHSNGNIGINSTAPIDKLSVSADNYRGVTVESSTTAHRPTLSLRNTIDSRLAYIQGVGNDIAFGRANVDYGGHYEVVRISGSNVGIGLTNPDWHLDIKSTSVNAVVRLKSSGSTNGGQLQVNSDDLILRNRDAGDLQLWTNDAERLRIDSNGVFDFKDNNINNVGYIALDYIKGDADDDTNITFAGNDTITFKAGSTSPALTVNTTQVKVEDNQKFVAGTGNDLQIYHDGANSYVSDQGTGDLRLSGNVVKLNNQANTATMIKATEGGSVELNHNNSKKFETTTTGAKVTGALEVTQEYPSIRPTLDLNFAATKSLDRRITFTRDGVGTYTDELGIVKYASNNTPRFDHDPVTGESLGLLIEEGRTNLITYSEDFSQDWSTVRATISTNTTTAPDGTTTADSLIPNSFSSSDGYTRFYYTVSNSTNYSYSIFVKQKDSYFDYVYFNAAYDTQSGTGRQAWFRIDPGNGSVGTTTGGATALLLIEEYPNGWYRCTINTTSDTTGSVPFVVVPVPADNLHHLMVMVVWEFISGEHS